MDRVAQAVREYRNRKQLSQEQLAKTAGISVRTLREIEQGRTRLESPSLQRLIGALGLDSAAFGSAHIAVLGPLEIRMGNLAITAPSAAGQIVLGLLALHYGRTVPLEEIAEVLWPSGPPASWRNLVHGYVSKLRSLLEPTRDQFTPSKTITSTRIGYRLLADQDTLDLSRFDRHLASAASTTDRPTAIEQYQVALELWRGPFVAIPDERLASHPAALAAQRRRLTATLSFAELALAAGAVQPARAYLQQLAEHEPLHEKLHVLLMTALSGEGHPAEALALYRGLQHRLADELGIDPGIELQRCYQEIISTVPVERRRFLPRGVSGFVGRTAELDWLESSSRSQEAAATVLISSIGGVGGVGKTALVLHWARRVADRYPDGQLYINLHGYDASHPMSALEALGQLLRMMGMDASDLPSTVDEASARFRALTAEQQMLVVLDNASSVDQVRPLLPGGKDTFVVITSRDRLTGLVAIDGAHRLSLSPMPEPESVGVLRQVLGTRVDREPEAAAALAVAAGHLPLALRIAAANLQERPRQPLADYLTELLGDRLTTLTVEGDSLASLRAVFSHSYRSLAPHLQRAFCLIGVIPSADFPAGAAAAAMGLTLGETREILTGLGESHLLYQENGRYYLHDLVRLYAQELAAESPQAPDAFGRLVRWYLGVVSAADHAIRPERALTFEPPQQLAVSFDGELEAVDWLDQEGEAIASIVSTSEHSLPELCWQLTQLLPEWLARRRSPAESLAVLEAGARAAKAINDASKVASARGALVSCLYYLKRYDEALETAHEVVTLRRNLHDDKALALAVSHHAILLAQAGHDEQAVAAYEEALRLLAPIEGMQQTQGSMWNNLGWAHYLANRYNEAIGCYTSASRIAHESGNRAGISFAEGNLGLIYGKLGEHERQAQHWHLAAEAGEASGDHRLTANSYQHLGRAYSSLGDTASARAHLEKALAIYVSAQNLEDVRLTQGLLASLEPGD